MIFLFIVFILIYLLLSAILIFYLDLANGPFYLLIVEIIVLMIVLAFRIIFRKKKFLFRLLAFLILILFNVPILILAKPTVSTFKATDEIRYTDVLHLKNGDVVGTYSSDDRVQIYTGVPYAKAPVGELRFREPQDVEDREGVLDCTNFAPRAMQVDQTPVISTLVDMYAEGGWHPNYEMQEVQEMSEDCLYLNIWKPNYNIPDLPILVYIHGGSLTNGSSANSDYNGETYAKYGVIMITISYRLGVFGYFAHPDLIDESINNNTGNYGLLDQIKALEWINENAVYFGGDKNNITIAGESAGSSSVSALCASPLAKGLFKRAIGESSSLVVKNPPHTFRSLDSALKMGQDIMDEFGCKSIDELRQIDAKELVKTKYTNSAMTLDGYALTKTPYQVYLDHENNEEALLNGYNVKEADAFLIPTYLLSPTNKDNILERLINYFGETTANKIYELYEKRIEKDAFSSLNEIMSVYWFIYPHKKWSDLAFENGVTVYRYQFMKENGYYGTYHSGELIYVYGNIERSKHSFAYDNKDIKLQDSMVAFFTNFIKYGDPNGIYYGYTKMWPEYSYSGQKVIWFNKEISMGIDMGIYKELYVIFDEYMDSLGD